MVQDPPCHQKRKGIWNGSLQHAMLCLVRWYGIVDRKKFKIDDIDKTVETIGSRSQRTPAEQDRPTPKSAFGLITVESIWRAVHAAPRDFFMSQTSNFSE